MSAPASGPGATAGAAALLLAAGAGAVALLGLVPPAPRPADAGDELFSAARARPHVERLAPAPRPGGTLAHAAARDALVERLRELGLATEVQVATPVRVRRDGTALAARVENVVGRLAGTASEGAVVLMAHYDTRPRTFGAGDDAAGTAAVLETVRALAAGPPPRNDVVVLLTDAEEAGLMGAQAFAEEHRWAENVAAVLNLEARGNAGPANMFETGPGNLALVRMLAEADSPFANSLGYEVYRRMPNDTDFSVFRQRGDPGLNFAFLNGHPAYHSMLDTADRLSARSLQHLGEQALAVTRRLASGPLPPPGGEDGIFFNPLRGWLVVYPAGWAPGLLAAAALLGVVALLLGLRSGRLRLGGVVAGLGTSLAALVGAAVVGFLFWWAIGRFFAGLLKTPHGLPYGTPLFGAALAALVAAWCFWAATFRPGLRPLELAAGAAVAWLGLGAAATFLMPGVSYLLVWPGLALAAAVALAAAGRGEAAPGPRSLAALAVAAAVALLLHVPVAALVVVALTLRLSLALAVLMALPLLSLLALARMAQPGSRPWLALALAAMGVALWTTALVRARPSPERPRVDNLAYVLDAEEGEGGWWSVDEAPDAWTRHLLGDEPRREPAPFDGFRSDEMLFAPAPPLDLPAPRLEVLSEQRRGGDESRLIEARVRSLRGAPMMRLEAESSVPLRLVSVAGKPVEPEPLGEGDDGFRDEVAIDFYAPPPEGVRFVIEVPGRWPVEARLVDQSFELPPSLEVPPRPPGLISSISWRTDSTFVAKTVFF